MLHRLPDLAYQILGEITDNQTMTQNEIASSLQVDAKNVKYAIRRLLEHDLIHNIPNLMDMRIVHYRLPTVDEVNNVKDQLMDEVYYDVLKYIKDGNYFRSVGEYPQPIKDQEPASQV